MLSTSGTTEISWQPTGVSDSIDQALDIDNAVLTGARWLELYGVTPKFFPILYPYPATMGVSNFNSVKVGAQINKDDAFDWGVLLHEYGHYVADVASIDNNTPVQNGNHDPKHNATDDEADKSQGVALAWDEGFADFFSQMVQRAMGTMGLGLMDVGAMPPTYIDQLPTPTGSITIQLDVPGNTPPYFSLGEDNEIAVARVLWAFYDQTQFSGVSGSVAFIKALSEGMKLSGDLDLSGAVNALETALHAQPWVPDVGRSSTDAELPVHFNEELSATTYGAILSSQNVASTITTATLKASDSSIKVIWKTGQPNTARDRLNLFLVQFWNSDWTKLLTEQLVTERYGSLGESDGSDLYFAGQQVGHSWGTAVNVVVLGWNTKTAPTGLTIPSGTRFTVPGLSPLTGPYISAPVSVALTSP